MALVVVKSALAMMVSLSATEDITECHGYSLQWYIWGGEGGRREEGEEREEEEWLREEGRRKEKG